ncbi:30S ribosomal protein S15 [uncultured archaeon]|nr:30S ribosomal protein S15 [uncultured archaeon]
MPEKIEENTEEKQEEKTKKPKKKSQEEFEKRVIELAEKGLTGEKIGEALKKEGIHSKEYKKKISEILGGRYVSPDMKNIQEKLEKLEKHSAKNKGDKRAMRDKERVSAKLRRLNKYLNK